MHFLYQIGLLLAKITGILDINWLVIFSLVFIKDIFSSIGWLLGKAEERMNAKGVK